MATGIWETRRRSPAWRRAAAIAAIRAGLSAISPFCPELCARCSEYLFLMPPRQHRSRREQSRLDAGSACRFSLKPGVEIALWRWGRGPLVLLVHGWGGHAGRLTAFVPPLLEAGFSVAAFDAPGHGSSGGRLATLPDFVESLAVLARRERPAALIGHSMGATACALAIHEGLRVAGSILLAPAEDPEKYARRFARWLRVPTPVGRSMTRRLERRYARRMEDLRLSGITLETPALIFHDTGDRRVPIRDSRAIAAAWPAARLVTTRGLGHHRILRDSEVLESSVRFLRRAVLAPARLALGAGA